MGVDIKFYNLYNAFYVMHLIKECTFLTVLYVLSGNISIKELENCVRSTQCFQENTISWTSTVYLMKYDTNITLTGTRLGQAL